jgi:hypothetical protein
VEQSVPDIEEMEADELCYKMSMTDYVTYVSVAQARAIIDQLKEGIEVLVFRDVNHSLTYLPIKDFKGMWETSPEIRRRCYEWNEAMIEEEKQMKNRWED